MYIRPRGIYACGEGKVMASIYLCSPTNSTIFTTCCDTAILNHEVNCPSCKKRVFPFYDCESAHERGRYRWSHVYKPPKRMGKQ
jgi:hypothetical protein